MLSRRSRYLGRLLHKLDPDTVEKKREEKKNDRKVSLHHGEHGWSTLSIDLPSHVASAIYQKLSCAAHDLRKVDKTRTTDQIRADIAAYVLMAMAEGDSTVKAHVYVYVDMLSLLRLNNEPGYLPGYGHIPVEMAREMATDPNSTRHPRLGQGRRHRRRATPLPLPPPPATEGRAGLALRGRAGRQPRHHDTGRKEVHQRTGTPAPATKTGH